MTIHSAAPAVAHGHAIVRSRHAARIVVRMLAFNVLVVFLPVAGLFYLGTGCNLSVPIVAHGIADTVDLLLICLGEYTGMGR